MSRKYIAVVFAIAGTAGAPTAGGSAIAADPTSQVPFVGCKSDGQMGAQDAPTGDALAIHLEPAISARLAFYKAEQGPGVLGPRGWACFGIYGSNGASLFVAPVIADSKVLSSDWEGLTWAGIQLSESYGATSGRFSVAETLARVFPKERSFVDAVINEGIFPASAFPFGPYPGDQLAFVNDRVVKYRTPPNSEGLGTKTWLKPNADPIEGAAIYNKSSDPFMITLAVRLPAELSDLAHVIVQQAISDYDTP